MIRKTLKILLYISLSVLGLLIAVAVFSQTGLFKSTLRSTLYSLADDNLNASIYIGQIHGNLVTGLTIDTVVMYVHNSPFVRASNVAIKYDPLPLWRKHIAIIGLNISKPSVTLIRFPDGSLNVDYIAKEKSKEDTTPSPWVVTVKNLHITDGRFRFIDSTAIDPADPPDSAVPKRIHFSDIALKDLSIDLSASLSGKDQVVSIQNISFVSPREDFTLNKLALEFHHTKTMSEVRNLLLITPQSHIELSGRLSGGDIFAIKDLASLKTALVQLNLTSTTVASEDLQRFLPSLDFLRGSVYVELVAGGEFGDVKVSKLFVSTKRTEINLEGSVANLHDPEELALNIESKGSIIHPPDAPELMPYFHIPNYSHVGELKLNFHYIGKPLDFHVVATAVTDAGTIKVDGGLNLTHPVMQYSGKVAGEGVNLDKFFSSSSLRSNLNFNGAIDGEGTNLDELHSTVNMEVDSSVFNGVGISHAQFQASAVDKKIKTDLHVQSLKGNLALQSVIGTSDDGEPSYSISGKVNQLDLDAVFKSEQFASNCSFNFSADGKGISLEKMNSEVHLKFEPSRFRSSSFDSGYADISIQQDSLHTQVTVRSPIADGTVDGSFSFEGLADAIMANINGVRYSFVQEMKRFDSTFAQSDYELSSAQLRGGGKKEQSLQYNIRLKDLAPIAVFFAMNPFDAKGELHGTVKIDGDTLYATGDANIQSGQYTTSSSQLYLENADLQYRVGHLLPKNLFSSVEGPSLAIKIRADNLYNGATQFHKPSLDCRFENKQFSFSAGGGIDTTLGVSIAGSTLFSSDSCKFVFDTISARYNQYFIANASPVSLNLDADGIALDSVLFMHDSDRVSIGGVLNFHHDLNVKVSLSHFSLPGLSYLGASPIFKANMAEFQGTAGVQLAITGTIEKPVIQGMIKGSQVVYRDANFGSISGAFRYENDDADVTLRLARTDTIANSDELIVTGTVPIDLAFTSVEKRFSHPGLDLYCKTSGFDVSILDPFINELSGLQGLLQSTIHCTGSLGDPNFVGTLELQQSQFTMAMNGITYDAQGAINLEGDTIKVSSFTIQNLKEDSKTTGMNIGGFITLRKFIPQEFHLTANGELMVLEKEVRPEGQEFYGDLVASTGDNGINFIGTKENSSLTGDIFIQSGSLIFPPTREAETGSSSEALKIIVVNDTSLTPRDTTIISNAISRLLHAPLAQQPSGPSLLDGLAYDLNIETKGLVQIKMVFNAATNEELFADLNGKLVLSKEDGKMNLTGTINLSDRSSYTFYKKFDASGSLKFTGDPQNPQLDITAQYTGTHINPKDTTTENVVVSLAISGTRYEPKLKLGLSTIDKNGVETERTGDVEGDAISFLLTSSPGTPGKFRDDLTSSDKQNIASSLGGQVGGALISGYANTLMSGLMMDFLRANNINLVSNVEFRYAGTSPDLQMNGEILDAYWSVGGRVFNDINNANFSLQFPLGPLVKDEKLRNFVVEVDRKTDVVETTDPRRATTGARLYYKIAF
jgi:TamB, inner membrane protein subunit of TAM complex